jgi:hypothetical protein
MKLLIKIITLVSFLGLLYSTTKAQNICKTTDEFVEAIGPNKFSEVKVLYFYVDKPFVVGTSPENGLVIFPKICHDSYEKRSCPMWMVYTENQNVNDLLYSEIYIYLNDVYNTRIQVNQHLWNLESMMYKFPPQHEKEYMGKITQHPIKRIEVWKKSYANPKDNKLIVSYDVSGATANYFIDFYYNLENQVPEMRYHD